jgi:hypothetical protein
MSSKVDTPGLSLISRRLIVRAKDVVFVKGVIEAHDGLANVFSESGGDLMIVAPSDRAAEVDDVVRSLAEELGGILSDQDAD